MPKRRIIYVWNYREWGGAQIYFLSLMKAARARYEVSVMLPSGSDRKLLDYLDAVEVPYDFLDPAPSMVGPHGVIERLRRRRALWRSESALVDKVAAQADLEHTIVHIDMGFWQSFRALYRLSKLTNVVMTLHTALPAVAGLRSMIWKIKGLLMSRRPTFHLMASNRDAKRGVRPYISAAKFDSIEVAYSGFDPKEIEAVRPDAEAVRARFALDPKVPLIVTSGQFIERKGCWAVLEGLQQLKNAGAEFSFLWLGTSAPDAALQPEIDQYGLEASFRLLSPDDIGPARNDLLSIVAVADIFVLASTEEGLPISLVEAMALGRACIATRVGAVTEALRDDENGVLVEPNDASALSAALGDLLVNETKRIRLGSAASATVTGDLDASRTAEKVVKFYDSIWQT